jgi:probable O-glycosylation ligase (exosortase A-associated)
VLRTIFVLVITAVGVGYSLKGPFQLLLFYLWYAYFRPEDWVWDKELILSLRLSLWIGIALVISSLVSRNVRLRFDLKFVLVFLFVLHGLCSTLLSGHRDWAMGWWLDFARQTTVAYMLFVLVDSEPRMRAALLTISLSLGLEGAKQGWLQLLRNPDAKNYNHHPVLGDENGMAQGMLMLVPLLLALAQTANRKWQVWLYRLVAAGVFFRAIFTWSRGGLLAAIALGAVYLLRSRQKLRSIVGIAVVSLIILPVLPEAFWERMGTLTTAHQEEARDESASGRIHFWKVAVSMAASNPLFGVGFNSYMPAYDSYDFSEGRFKSRRAVHSAWFGLMSDLGFVGLLLFVAVLACAFSSCRTARKFGLRYGDARTAIYATALGNGLVAWTISATFLSAQYNEFIWDYMALCFALAGMAKRSQAALSFSAARRLPTLDAAVAATARRSLG